MKKLLAVGCALVSAFAAFAEGENPYPEYDFYLTADDSESNTKNSWNKTGHWSGEWPDDAVNKTFYVPAGKKLCSYGDKTTSAGPWLGGTLTVAGTFSASPVGGASYGASITNLVFLDDSTLRGGANGFLLNGSEMTVKAAADHPLTIQYDYAKAGSSYFGRIFAIIHGAPGTGIRATATATSAEAGMRFYTKAFENFFGTLTVAGAKNNPMQPSSNSHWFTSPGKLVVTDSAGFTPSFPTASTARNNVLLGALDVNNGGIIDFRCNSTDAYVTFGVTNSVKVSDGGIVRVSNVSASKLVECAKSGAASDYRMAVRLANLTGDAKEQVDVDDAKVEMSGLDEIFDEIFGWKLIVQDNADGSKELYAGVTNVAVCIKNGGSGAQPDDSTLWAGGILPQEGVDFYCPYRFNPIKDWDYTNSKIILGNSGSGHYWMNSDKATLDLNAKAYYVLESTGFSVYSTGNRRLRGGPLTIVDGATLSFSLASGSTQLRIDSEIVGNGGLTLRQRAITSKYQATLENINTDWHGRLKFINHQGVAAGKDRVNTTIVSDARNWGGAFLADADTYSAVTLASNTCVYVTNNVCFNDPTRGFLLSDTPCFKVAASAKLTLSNQVTYAGIVEKEGAGVLNLGGTARFEDGQAETAPVDGRCGLVVSAGTLEVSSQEAVDGLQVSFAAGTKLVVGKDCGFYNVKSANPITIADEKLPVEIAGFDEKPEGGDVEVAVLTLNKAAAEGIGTDKFAFTKTKTCRVLKFEKREVGDNVEYVATVAGTKGIVFIVR